VSEEKVAGVKIEEEPCLVHISEKLNGGRN
jgi:hypothetical protein